MIKLKDIIGEDIAKDIAKEITAQNEAIKGYDQAMKKMLTFMKKSAEKQHKKSFPSTYESGHWEHPAHLKKGPKFDRIVNVRAK